MRCKNCHLVLKYPSDQTKKEQLCKSCRKQLEIVEVLRKSFTKDIS